MKSFAAFLPVIAIAIAQGAAMMVIPQGSAIAVTYPAPFPNAINSVFGPRNDGSPLHSGIDYLGGDPEAKNKSIPAVANGYISDIRDDSDNNNCGVRLYLVTTDKKEIGYCHLFKKTTDKAYTGGGFTLVKNFDIFRGMVGLRVHTKKCNIILINDPKIKIALVPNGCAFAVGQTIRPFEDQKIVYTVANKVAAKQLIASVGDSGTASGINSKGTPFSKPHLHVNYNRPLMDNPLQVIDHAVPNGVFCARLSDAGNSTTACPSPSVSDAVPVIQQSVLTSRKYIDVRVDFTGKLDLDGAQFNIFNNSSGSVIQSYSLQYGGSETTSPLVNRSSNLKISIDLTCADATTPPFGDVYICPKKWDGQQVPSSPLETKFRLGVDASVFAPGNYRVEVILQSVTGVATTISLPFTISGGIPTATLLVPDLQANWGGLPATISLTDLVVIPQSQFQVFGNSSTCGTGERGAPLYSNVVPAAATFYAARTVTGMPYQLNGPSVNRRNCSSFVAVQMVPNPVNPAQMRPRIFINGTGRGQLFSTFTFDWEYQVRFDSGDPWDGTGRSCIGGTVPNSGFFGAAWSAPNCSASLNF